MLNKVRELKKEASGSKAAGFTIIEVMIVLAIAGLIMAIVFVAIPQLQKNTRNTKRRDVAGRIKAEIDNYATNNNGSYPTANLASAASNIGTPSTALGFFARYIGCKTAAGTTTCTTDISDPSTNSPMGIGTYNGTAQTQAVAVGAVPAVPTVVGSWTYSTGTVCSGENVTTTGASARNYAFAVLLEGGAVYCADNH